MFFQELHAHMMGIFSGTVTEISSKHPRGGSQRDRVGRVLKRGLRNQFTEINLKLRSPKNPLRLVDNIELVVDLGSLKEVAEV
jgi:hypothetical protein